MSQRGPKKEGRRQEQVSKFSCDTSPAVKARSWKTWSDPKSLTIELPQNTNTWASFLTLMTKRPNFAHWSSIGCSSLLILHNLISCPRSCSQYPLQTCHWQPQHLEILTISLWSSLSFGSFLAEINLKLWTQALPNHWHACSACSPHCLPTDYPLQLLIFLTVLSTSDIFRQAK